ncbi:MAG TPA: hypothetical protein VGF24_30980 [Vicinamibacterales bacterium]
MAWSREDGRLAISILVRKQRAIVGGELWWVKEDVREWTGLIPQRQGSAVYSWETMRASGEDWATFVMRCAADSLQAIERWPAIDDLPTDLEGRILCNLTRVDGMETPAGSCNCA